MGHVNMKPSGRIYSRDNRYELATYWLVLAQSLSHVQLFVTPWTEDLPGSSVHDGSPGKNNGVGCHFLLQVSSSPKDQTRLLHLLHGQVDYHCTTGKAHISSSWRHICKWVHLGRTELLWILNCECKANKGDTERTLRKIDQEKECWEPLLSYKPREKRAFQEDSD